MSASLEMVAAAPLAAIICQFLVSENGVGGMGTHLQRVGGARDFLLRCHLGHAW